jgi:mRNA-degrading endonuclease YafQ of YafQ-DinJ toxin-antitoxin module
MRSPSCSGQFKHDAKLASRRGKDTQELRHVIGLLLTGRPPPRESNETVMQPATECRSP